MSKTDRPSRRKMQPGRCLVCQHPDRVQIELAICEGVALTAIAKRWSGPSRWALARHASHHITPARKLELVGSSAVVELVEAAAKEDQSLLSGYALNRKIATNRLLACAEVGDTGGINLMLARLHENYAGVAKLTGQVGNLSLVLNQNNTTISFDTSPAYLKLVEVVLEELRDLPEKRANIIRAIRNIEDSEPEREPPPVPMIEGELVHA